MNNILIFSDIHIHSHKSSLRRLQDCLDALRWVFQVAESRHIKDIVFLGDLFQDREKIQVLPYQRTYEIISKYCNETSGINLYLLVGNHDMWFADKTDVSSLYPLGSIPGVSIINKPTTITVSGIDVDFLPFTLNPLKSIEVFAQERSNVLFGHLALDGAKLNTFYRTYADISVEHDGDMVKMDSSKFKAWKKVFLGHYHAWQKLGNIEYVGSPLQINFAEAFQQKHLIILNTDDLSQEYVLNDFSPRHYIIDETEIDKYNLKNSFVKLISKNIGSADIVDIKNSLLDINEALSVEFSSPSNHDDEETKCDIINAQSILGQNKEELLEMYMKSVQIPVELEFDRLLQIGKNLCQESQID